MKKQIIYSLVVLSSMVSFHLIMAGNNKKPFAELSKLAGDQWGGLRGDQDKLYKLFVAEKKSLGKDCFKTVLSFLGKDALKHQKVAQFLTRESDETNNDLVGKEALLIMNQGLAICSKTDDKKSKYTEFTLHILAAIQSKKLGLNLLASDHKKKAEDMITKNKKLGGAFPSLDEKDLDLYDAIPEDTK